MCNAPILGQFLKVVSVCIRSMRSRRDNEPLLNGRPTTCVSVMASATRVPSRTGLTMPTECSAAVGARHCCFAGAGARLAVLLAPEGAGAFPSSLDAGVGPSRDAVGVASSSSRSRCRLRTCPRRDRAVGVGPWQGGTAAGGVGA